MKINVTFFTFFLFLISTSIISATAFEDFINENYEGGNELFLPVFYKGLKYPKKARTNCEIGVLQVRLTIDPDGELSEINYLNSLGYGIEKAVSKAIQKTKGNWKKAEETRKLDFTVGFSMGNDLEIKTDVLVVARRLPPQMGGCDVIPTSELLAKISTLMKKKKYKKARKICNELLKRNPYSDHYQGLYTTINAKVNQ